MNLAAFTSIEVTIDEGVARIVLNAPDAGNPINGVFVREIREAVTGLSLREDVRAVLIAAKGRFFSVGGDVKAFAASREALPGIIKSWAADLHVAVGRLMRLRAPVVAVVHGNAIGGSVSLIAAADIVFCADNVRFSAAFSAIGFSADSGSTVTLSQRMGFARAKRFLLMAETLTADAREAGLVDFVTDADSLMTKAEATAKEFAAGATVAFGGIKELMLRARTQGIETQMEDEAQMLACVGRSADSWEGITSFLEKRRPRFQGK